MTQRKDRQPNASVEPLILKSALTRDFFSQDTVEVAKALLGHYLVLRDAQYPENIVCKVVETEAYTQDDPSCHAFKGPKGRGATLFKEPGLAYVYFIYGMYHCLNVITEPEGRAGAVLFRGLEPISITKDRLLKTNGPGRLCKALGITRHLHNERPLTDASQPLYLCEGEAVPSSQIVTTTRIGISVAQDYPWRFYLRNNPWVSVPDKSK